MTARSMLAGAAATLSAISAAIGAFASAVPTESVIGPLARMLDAYTPWWLGFAIAVALLAMTLGARRIELALAIAVAVGGGLQLLSYRDVTRTIDLGQTPDLRVLFFNANADNAENGERIVEAAIETRADILIFAEAEALLDHLDALNAAFGFVSPCQGETCELLIATNLPMIRSWQLQLNPAWPERYAVTEVEVPDRGSVFIAAGHLAKPWMSGISEPELAQVTAQLNWLTGPTIIVGDFNMPAWSRPMRALLQDTGFRAVRFGPGTWPVSAPGWLRLPIDHVLTREDVTLTSVAPFGEALGSNHAGVLAGAALP